MKDLFNIRKIDECLSSEELAVLIDNKLPAHKKQLIEDHLAGCELCREAVEGAKLFPGGLAYARGVKKMRAEWSGIKLRPSGRSKKLYAMLAIAACILVLASVFSLLKSVDGANQDALLALSETSSEQLHTLIQREQVLVRPAVTLTKIDLEPNEGKASNQNKSSIAPEPKTPLVQLGNTAVYANKALPEGAENKNQSQHSTENNTASRLKYPFRVMSHAPANLQMNLPDEEEAPDDIFMLVEDMPAFSNELYTDFMEYIRDNIHYPVIAQEEGISGRVYVQFTVQSTGKIADVELLKPVHESLDAEVIQLVKNSPAWEPGRQRGKAVDVSMVIPVDFVLHK